MTTNDGHHPQSVSFESQRSKIYSELKRDLQTLTLFQVVLDKKYFISLPCLRKDLFMTYSFKPRTYTQSHPHRSKSEGGGGGGAVMEPPPSF